MKRSKFVQQCAERSRTTPEHVLEHHDVVRCDCGKKKCPGWRAVYKLRNRREKLAPRVSTGTSGYIYFAQLGDRIKIGFSTNPTERVHSLNAVLLGSVLGTRDLEAELHSEFADLRERGEWFRLDPRLVERIGVLCAK